jgi:hypothetical protein
MLHTKPTFSKNRVCDPPPQNPTNLTGQEAAVPPEYDQFVWLLPEFALDEAQQVLLVHARTVVDVRVNLQDSKSTHTKTDPSEHA